MVTSRKFSGKALPKHKSIPDVSRLYDLARSTSTIASIGVVVRTVEEWSEVVPQRLRIEAARIPGSDPDQIRVLALLHPEG